MMPSINGTIVIRDDHNNLIGHRKLEYVTHEKWDKTERAGIIAFLEKKLDTKQIDPVQEDINRISALIRLCLEEARDIVANELDGGNMTTDARAERTESLGALIYFKLTEPPSRSTGIQG